MAVRARGWEGERDQRWPRWKEEAPGGLAESTLPTPHPLLESQVCQVSKQPSGHHAAPTSRSPQQEQALTSACSRHGPSPSLTHSNRAAMLAFHEHGPNGIVGRELVGWKARGSGDETYLSSNLCSPT